MPSGCSSYSRVLIVVASLPPWKSITAGEPMATETSELLYTTEGPLAFVTFNRPEARNAMTWGMYDRLYELCDEIDADPDVRVVVFQGAGDRAFVAGTDISQFQSFSEERHALEYEER